MSNTSVDKENNPKNPHEDSMVTSNHPGEKKVDANPENKSEQPGDGTNLVTEESQKGKKVDADLELESDQPTDE